MKRIISMLMALMMLGLTLTACENTHTVTAVQAETKNTMATEPVAEEKKIYDEPLELEQQEPNIPEPSEVIDAWRLTYHNMNQPYLYDYPDICFMYSANSMFVSVPAYSDILEHVFDQVTYTEAGYDSVNEKYHIRATGRIRDIITERTGLSGEYDIVFSYDGKLQSPLSQVYSMRVTRDNVANEYEMGEFADRAWIFAEECYLAGIYLLGTMQYEQDYAMVPYYNAIHRIKGTYSIPTVDASLYQNHPEYHIMSNVPDIQNGNTPQFTENIPIGFEYLYDTETYAFTKDATAFIFQNFQLDLTCSISTESTIRDFLGLSYTDFQSQYVKPAGKIMNLLSHYEVGSCTISFDSFQDGDRLIVTASGNDMGQLVLGIKFDASPLGMIRCIELSGLKYAFELHGSPYYMEFNGNVYTSQSAISDQLMKLYIADEYGWT